MIALALCAAAHAATLPDVWSAVEAGSAEQSLLESRTDAAETIVGATLGTLGPRGSISGSYTVNQFEASFDPSALFPGAPPGDPIVIQAKDAFGANLTVGQTLFSGSAYSSYKAAVASARAARADEDAGTGDLRFATAQVFWTVLASREAETISAASTESARRHLALIQARAALDDVARPVVLGAEIDVLVAERNQLDAHSARVRVELDLARLSGLPADVPLEAPARREIPYADLESAVARVQSCPRVVAAQERATAAARVHDATALGWLPSANARFTEMYSENTGFAGEKLQWQAALTADWTFWDGGVRVAKTREASFNAATAATAADREAAVTETEIVQRWLDLDSAIHGLELATRQRGLAETRLSIAEETYALGGITALDLSDARLGLDAARMAVVRSEMAADLAALSLLRSTGDL